MKTLLIILLAMQCIFAAQAQTPNEDKKSQLQKLKEQQDSLTRQVQRLEQEVVRADTATIALHNNATEYISEWPMQQVTAVLTDRRTNLPAAGIRSYLSVPGNNFELRTAISDHEGKVTFLLQHVYSTKPMIFQTDPRRDSAYRFEVADPFEGKRFSQEDEKDSLAFFGSPDKRYMLDDYTRFPTMEEVLIEYVPEIKIKKVRGHYALQVLNTPYKTFFEEQPIVLLDGVPIFNLDALMSIDPLKIKKLEVMARRYYYGSLAWDGVVSFSSYDGDLAGYSLYDNAIVKDFHK